jgi:hypothetical protein
MQSNGLEFRLAKCKQQQFLFEAEKDRLAQGLSKVPLAEISHFLAAIVVRILTAAVGQWS